ncbi:hypothetical protein QUF72_03410 [Desulfobacterales bacterium HSG2]|nr:hypothetical protein [Desulfobacterales bacterium HSG2]
MLFELVIAGVLYAGNKIFSVKKIGKKKRKSLFGDTRRQQFSEISSVEGKTVEVESRYLTVSLVSLWLAGTGIFYPLAGILSLPL